MAEHHHRTIPQRFREERPWSGCRCPPQTCRMAKGLASIGKGHAPGPSPLPHGGAPARTIPQRFREGRPWSRRRCRCSPQTCRLAEDLAGIGQGARLALPASAGTASMASSISPWSADSSPLVREWRDGRREGGDVATCQGLHKQGRVVLPFVSAFK